jgi:hypothetical protein
MSRQVKVTLELWFESHEIEEMMMAEDMEDVEKKETAFALMEDSGFNWIEHLKTFDPLEFVEYLYLDDLGTVSSAKWLDQGMIEFIVDLNNEACAECSDTSDAGILKHLKDALLDESLEDGEWEGEDNGWVIMTKPLADGITYEYGLIDYRRPEKIHVEFV